MRTASIGGAQVKRTVLALLAVALVVISLLCATSAGAQSNRTPVDLGDDQDPATPGFQIVFPAGQYCDFPAYLTITRNKEYVIHETTDADGTTTLQVAGSLKVSVTNAATGKSLPYNISGPGTYVFYSDGSFSLDVTGHNLLWTTRANSFPGVPPLNYTKGHVTVEVAASGLTTAYHLRGQSTDVCAVLATA
jgi:hypothetical protein